MNTARESYLARYNFDSAVSTFLKDSLSKFLKVDSLMNPLVSSMRTVTKVVRLESSSLKESGNNEESLDNVQTLSGIPLYVS